MRMSKELNVKDLKKIKDQFPEVGLRFMRIIRVIRITRLTRVIRVIRVIRVNRFTA